MLGDPNVRLGSGMVDGDEWDRVHGRHGVGLMNEGSEALLSW